MEIIEHKIGETFCLEDGTKLQVVKATCNCKDCYFFNSKNNICSRTKDIICSAPRREDKDYYVITKKSTLSLFIKYKGFCINKNMYKSDYEIAFNTKEAAKKAIDILGDELNVLFE